MPMTAGRRVMKDGVAHRANGETNFHHSAKRAEQKNTGGSWFNIGSPGQKVTNQNPTRREASDSCGWSKDSDIRGTSSKSSARKAASARIAKIPSPLARHIAQVYKPREEHG
jgi:hypothetical protein